MNEWNQYPLVTDEQTVSDGSKFSIVVTGPDGPFHTFVKLKQSQIGSSLYTCNVRVPSDPRMDVDFMVYLVRRTISEIIEWAAVYWSLNPEGEQA